jgi:hypothetical protein
VKLYLVGQQTALVDCEPDGKPPGDAAPEPLQKLLPRQHERIGRGFLRAKVLVQFDELCGGASFVHRPRKVNPSTRAVLATTKHVRRTEAYHIGQGGCLSVRVDRQAWQEDLYTAGWRGHGVRVHLYLPVAPNQIV